MPFYIKHNFNTEPNKDNSCLVEKTNIQYYDYLEIPDTLMYCTNIGR
jgi:hypothetical protein